MGTNIGEHTFILFSRRSWVDGFGSLMDPAGALVRYNYSHGENEADTKAMASDWQAVADDLRTAIRLYKIDSESAAAAEANVAQ